MTIPIDPRYIPAFSIEDVLLDKDTGAPLSGGLVYFEYDDQRGLLKPIYQITGTSPNYTFIQMDNPVTLSSIGTFADTLGNPVIPYFFPYDANGDVELYYIRVTNSNDVPQFDREAQPYISFQESDEILSVITNDLSNPQFNEVLFSTLAGTYTYNVNAVSNSVINIAPDWDIIVSAPAAGAIIVTQLKPQGTLNIISNPGTLLTINSSGLTKLQLRQRIFGSPNLWGSGYLSASFVSKTYSGTGTTLNMFYSQSNGAVNELIKSALLPASGAYEQFSGSVFIPASNSSQTFPSAYIDIYFEIPLSIQIDITSIMVAFTGKTSIENITYNQESSPRQIDHLFHYYKPQIFFKEINSFLTGWDFPLNPAQFGSTKTVTTTPAYVWDQTIMASAVNNVAVVRGSVTMALQATTTVDAEAFYMLQYLTGAQALETSLSALAVNILAYSAVHPGVVVKVYLYNGNSASTIPATATSLGTIDSAGIFTLTAGANWTLIPQPNGNASSATLLQTFIQDFPLIGWDSSGTFYSAGTNNFAIVVTFAIPTSGTQVIVSSISCVPGNIATRPAPLTSTDVLNQCRWYWQKSFLPNVVPASSIGINSGESYGFQVTAGNGSSNPGPIVRYPIQMRTNPIVITFNPIAAGIEIANIAGSATWTNTNLLGAQSNGFYLTGNSNVGSDIGNACGIHWTANARLGDV